MPEVPSGEAEEILSTPATPGAQALPTEAEEGTAEGSDDVPSLDHVENTGDNLRHAHEVQQDASSGDESPAPLEQFAITTTLPDFNT